MDVVDVLPKNFNLNRLAGTLRSLAEPSRH
jgi:hypothetical protein